MKEILMLHGINFNMFGQRNLAQYGTKNPQLKSRFGGLPGLSRRGRSANIRACPEQLFAWMLGQPRLYWGNGAIGEFRFLTE